MNRRDFAKNLTAFAFTPLLSTLPARPLVAAPAFTPYMYGLGVHLARTKGASSPAILMKNLHLAPKAAQAMQAQLIRNGIVTAPGAAGFATAAQPYMRNIQLAQVPTPLNGVRVRRLARQILEKGETVTNDNSGTPAAPT